MLLSISPSLILVLATFFNHFKVLRWTSAVLPRCGAAGRARDQRYRGAQWTVVERVAYIVHVFGSASLLATGERPLVTASIATDQRAALSDETSAAISARHPGGSRRNGW